jgi:hypothetical protein
LPMVMVWVPAAMVMGVSAMAVQQKLVPTKLYVNVWIPEMAISAVLVCRSRSDLRRFRGRRWPGRVV